MFSQPNIYGSETQNNIQRLVYITDWGATVVDETITLFNNKDESVSKFRIGIPLDFKPHLRFAQAKDEAGHILTTTRIKDEDQGVFWIEVKFEEKGKGETFRFNLITVYSDLISFYQGSFYFNFTESPIIPERFESYNVTIILPTDSTIELPENHTFTKTIFNSLPALNAEFKPLEPYTSNSIYFSFQSITVQLFKVNWAERKIVLKPFGGIRFEDSYSITNLSTSTSQIEILLPIGSYNIMAFDTGGTIWEDPREGDIMSVSPRYGTIKSNESFTFTLKYDIPNDYLLNSRMFGPFELNLTLLTPQPFIIYKLKTEVVLPKGLTVNEINQIPNATSNSVYETHYQYDIDDITPFNDLSLEIKGKHDSFWAAVRPVGWIAMLEAAVCALYVSLKGKRPVAEERVAVPVEQLREATDLTDEKIALRIKLEKLDEKLAKKAISKKDYRRSRRNIEARLTTINRLIKPIKTNLANINPRYGETLTMVDKAEAEIEATNISIRNVRIQYRMGKIDKDTYLSILEDLRRRLENAKSRLETLNITLKEETG